MNIHRRPPAASPQALSVARQRQAAADEIERLLAFLDATDGDPDLEDDREGEEPETSDCPARSDWRACA